MKKHKFKLDKKYWDSHHRSLFDLKALFYIPRCKTCGQDVMWGDEHLPEKFKIPTIRDLSR